MVGARTFGVISQESLVLNVMSSILPQPSFQFPVHSIIMDLVVERNFAQLKQVSAFPPPFIQVSEKGWRPKAEENIIWCRLFNVDCRSLHSLADETTLRSENLPVIDELLSYARLSSYDVIHHPSLPLPFSEEPPPRPPDDTDAFRHLPTPPSSRFKQPPPRPPLLSSKSTGFPRILSLRGLQKCPPMLPLKLRGLPPIIRLWELPPSAKVVPRRPPEPSFSCSSVTSVPSSIFPTQTRTLSATPNRILGFIQQDSPDDRDGKQDCVSAHLVPYHNGVLLDHSAHFKERRRCDRGRGNPVRFPWNPVRFPWLNHSPFSPVARENGEGVGDGGGDGVGGRSGFKDDDGG